MMATAREESKPYDDGLGAGGKFRKRPFRRTTQATPYDRPPTAIRNPSGGGVRNGWLSKLVDPAQRLITSSAHRLFASVFRKRLPPPPPHPPQELVPETNQEAIENPPEATLVASPVLQGAFTGCDNPNTHTDKAGVAELEEILKQKTFTRSEIDRLTTLLRSRTIDAPGGTEEKRSDVKSLVSYDKTYKFPKTPIKENGIENHLMSTPIVSSTVLDEDVASPAELAKAYMGSRPSKVSASMFGTQNQVQRADSVLPSNKTIPSKSPTMSIVPRSSSRVESLGNGFMTPRPRGRSAIYNMARAPYSRVNSAAFPKGVGSSNDAFGGPSSSSAQSGWEQNRISGSRQGALKRRISVLDNDIGSIGPIRRIRQKSNLISSKNLSLAASGGHLSVHEAGTSSASLDTQNHVSLRETPALLGEVRHNFTNTLAEDGDNSTPGTSFTPVPSKSSEMASKILQQLDKLVSSREKSPTKLSPSMLHGRALKSLENIDSSKFLENMHDSGNFGGSHTALPDLRDSTLHKQDKVEENGSKKLVALPDKSAHAVNSVDTNGSSKDNVPGMKAADSTVIKSVVQPPQKRRQAFQMSAHEDYLEVDDDDYPNGTAFSTVGEGREKLDISVAGSKNSAAKATVVERPSSLSAAKPTSSSTLNQTPDLGTSDGSLVVQKNTGITLPVAQLATPSVQATSLASQPTSTATKDAAASKESNATSPMLSFGQKVVPSKQPDAAAPSSGLASTNVGEVSAFIGSSGAKLGTSSDQKLENSSSFATPALGTTNSLSDKTDKDNNLNGNFFRTPETAISSATSTSAGSIFKFGASANSSLNNGSFASSPLSFSTPMPSVFPNNGQSTFSSFTNNVSFATNSDTIAAATVSATANVPTISTSSPSMQASVPSFSAPSIFKFESTGSTLSTPSVEAMEAKNKDTSSGNMAVSFGSTSTFTSSNFVGKSEISGAASSTSGGIMAAVPSSENKSSFGVTSSSAMNSTIGFFGSTFSPVTNTVNDIFGSTSATTGAGSSPFGGTSFSSASTGTSAAITSTGSGMFGFSAPAASTVTTQTQGSNPFSVANTPASAAGTGFAATTQSMPIQLASSASSSSPSPGLAGNTTSVFTASVPATKTFGSGTAFGMSPSSETNSFSSNSGTACGVFGSNLQAPNTSIFGSPLSSSSSGFSFNSSASASAFSNAPSIFGQSTGGSSSSIFSFTSSATTTTSQPGFGNTSPGTFGSAPSGNNDQMEDSMAEDTIQTSTTTFPSFAPQPPTSGFVFVASNPSGASSIFGASNPSGATSPFGGSNLSGANSFQFRGQPSIGAPQNPSPFQSSGSQEFGGAGGSFSLGTGGGDKSTRRIVKVRKNPRKK